MSNFEEFLKKINNLRKSYYRNPVQGNVKLMEAAKSHARDMVHMEKLSHTGSNGSGFDVRILEAGYQFRMAEENIAFATVSSEIFSIWCDSPPHRLNMLNPIISEIGYATAEGHNLELGLKGIYASLSLVSPMAGSSQDSIN